MAATSKKSDQRVLMHACGLVSTAGLCLVLYMAFIMPLDSKRAQVRDDRLAYEQANAELASTQRALSNDQAAIATLEENLKDNVQLVPEARVNARLGELSAIAEGSGITIAAMKPADASRTSHYTATPIRIEAEGTYAQFVQWLDALHENARDIEVRAFVIDGDPAPVAPRLSIKLDVTWYALPGVTPAATKSLANQPSEKGG